MHLIIPSEERDLNGHPDETEGRHDSNDQTEWYTTDRKHKTIHLGKTMGKILNHTPSSWVYSKGTPFETEWHGKEEPDYASYRTSLPTDDPIPKACNL